MRILFILNGETANRGCEAILLSTYDIVRCAAPGTKFINSSSRDTRTNSTAYLQLPDLRHKCHPFPLTLSGVRWQIAKRIEGRRFNFERFLAWSDFVFSLGGDNYSLDYGNVEDLLEANDRVLSAGRRLVIWGASIGPFDSQPGIERRFADQMKRAFAIVVREPITRRYLADLGLVNNVMLMPDPAFSLSAAPVELPRATEHLIAKGAIGLNLSPLLGRYRPYPEAWPEEAANWLRALLSKTGIPVLLVPHVMQRGNDDEAFLEDLMIRAGGSSDRLQLLSARELSSRQIKFVISRLRAFVGARTHATIASLSAGVPTISVGYSVKALGINVDIFGHTRWYVDHLKMNTHDLSSKVAELLSSENEVRSHLALRNREYRMDISEIRELLSTAPYSQQEALLP